MSFFSKKSDGFIPTVRGIQIRFWLHDKTADAWLFISAWLMVVCVITALVLACIGHHSMSVIGLALVIWAFKR